MSSPKESNETFTLPVTAELVGGLPAGSTATGFCPVLLVVEKVQPAVDAKMGGELLGWSMNLRKKGFESEIFCVCGIPVVCCYCFIFGDEIVFYFSMDSKPLEIFRYSPEMCFLANL